MRPKLIHTEDDEGEEERAAGVGPNPIPGGVSPFAPYGIFIHHNPLRTRLASIGDQGLGLPMIGSHAAISGTLPVRAKVSFDVEWSAP